MKRNFTYRLYPTRRQERELLRQFEICRLVWNFLLEDHHSAREVGENPPSAYDQMRLLTELKGLWPELGLQDVNAQVLQDVAARVGKAMGAYFRRIRSGEEPGYPRFKGLGRCNSMTFPQTRYRCEPDTQGRLKVSKVGCIKMRQHRLLQGTPKTSTVHRSPTGKWYVTFSCVDVPATTLPTLASQVGIDLGVREFVSFSDGRVVHNPRHWDGDAKDLKRAQRKKSAEAKGSLGRAARVRVEARVHERVANRRADFTNKLAKSVVEDYGTVFIEKLNPGKMGRNRRERRDIRDAAWGMFVHKLEAKAEEAGSRAVVKVNPAYTTRTCRLCGWVKPEELRGPFFECGHCGHVEDRDLHAAKNILALGQQGLAASAA